MRIWIDADACPAVIKDILYRAAERLKIELTLVANKALRTPPLPYLKALQVPGGMLRNYLDELRGTGERTGGPAALDNTDRKRFADRLDKLLSGIRR